MRTDNNNILHVIPEKKSQLLRCAVHTWGEKLQVDMAIEEMAELTKALLKLRRTGGDDEKIRTALENIREEMADVNIMMAQMAIIYGDTETEELAKLCRLSMTLEKAGVNPFGEEEQNDRA
jgi:NTP pyrophosphatase (non-canonical NTP hydrolase)